MPRCGRGGFDGVPSQEVRRPARLARAAARHVLDTTDAHADAPALFAETVAGIEAREALNKGDECHSLVHQALELIPRSPLESQNHAGQCIGQRQRTGHTIGLSSTAALIDVDDPGIR